MWRAFIEGKDPLLHVPEEVEVFSDIHVTLSGKWHKLALWPAFSPVFLQTLRQYHPELIILLNTRNAQDWVSSIRRWKDLRKRIIKADLPFLPSGQGSKDEELAQWIEGHNNRVRELFAGDPYFIEVAIEDENTPDILSERLGIKLNWWGIENANKKGQIVG